MLISSDYVVYFLILERRGESWFSIPGQLPEPKHSGRHENRAYHPDDEWYFGHNPIQLAPGIMDRGRDQYRCNVLADELPDIQGGRDIVLPAQLLKHDLFSWDRS